LEDAMTTSATHSVSTQWTAAMIVASGAGAADFASSLVRAWRNRRDAAVLACADARTLADLGLTRSDVRDALAEPLWRDPTSLLRNRVGERRGRARRS
jgi:uncharacterized protein YjiS (DUF1127 family)